MKIYKPSSTTNITFYNKYQQITNNNYTNSIK